MRWSHRRIVTTMLGAVTFLVVGFVLMEPFTWAVHRVVMHGPGWALHRSHHDTRHTRFEANDAYPVMFAAVVGLALAVGFNRPGWGWLVPLSSGVTLYGLCYALVHDGYIHRRLPMLRGVRLLDSLALAHAVHHRTGGEPFGMLAPIVARSERAPRDEPPSATTRHGVTAGG